MPLYEYHCDACQKVSEILVRSRDEVPVCPDCGSDRMRRLLSTFSPAGTHTKVNPGHVHTGPDCACCKDRGSHGCGMP